MINTALSISEVNWDTWLQVAADMRYVHCLEVPAELVLGGNVKVSEMASQRGLKMNFIRDLIAPEVTRNATDLADAARHELVSRLAAGIKLAGEHGVVLGTIDVGAERMCGDDDQEERLTRRVHFLRRLMPAAAAAGVTVALPARFPPAYPGAKQWETIGSIIHEVMHPQCKFAVDIFPAELPDDFDIQQFLRQCGYQMGVIRFNYEPMLGEGLGPGHDEMWARALYRHAFRGGVVFRPRNVPGHDAMVGVCQTVDRWANTFWNVFK